MTTTVGGDAVRAPARGVFAGLFIVALATLMYEILLTRIFSVTLYYHFAFIAISVAMFGMSVGAVLVYQFPRFFAREGVRSQCAISSLLFGGFSLLSFIGHLLLPVIGGQSLAGFNAVAPTYILTAIPFTFSGIAVALALTRYPTSIGRLYAADLAGAATGCLAFIYVLRITDGPTAVVVVATLGCLAALAFAFGESRRLVAVAAACALLFAMFAGVNTMLAGQQRPLLRLFWVKGAPEQRYLFDAWNSFSRVTVFGDPTVLIPPMGWGMSPVIPHTETQGAYQLRLTIDDAAGTVLTGFSGDLRKHGYLRYDIVNLAHFIKRNADVAAIGSGGGRDVLTALVFDQKSVKGIEINPDIMRALVDEFGDFTGHLERHPRVTLVNDEARSYIARQRDRFDIIQISLIDTFAATAAGAFVLSENSLYTLEAWEMFLKHLSPHGVLTCTRWFSREEPSEIYRLVSLASESLVRRGVTNPRDHIVLVRRMYEGEIPNRPDGVGTILVSPDPFTEADLRTLEYVVSRLRFEMVLSPGFSLEDAFARLASGTDHDRFIADYPLKISAPTDDGPFFFHMLRLRGVFDPGLRPVLEKGANRTNLKAVSMLATLLIVIVCLTILCILVPLILTTQRGSLKGSFPLFLYFAAIGLGFMLVEISQMQRLIVFLGHPVYALSVVLFALLLSSGLGSLLTERLGRRDFTRMALTGFSALLLILAVFGLATPGVAATFDSATTPVRIAISVGIIAGLGLFMGIAFPIGMRLAFFSGATALTPWLWGINGATSVTASVLAIVIALDSGISAAFWTGGASYLLGLLSLAWAISRARRAGALARA